MSSVKFFPIRWFEDEEWKSMQVIGRLQNGRSVYLRVGFKPYFTVRYPNDLTSEAIADTHSYLIGQTPVYNINELSSTKKNIFRVYLRNRTDYLNAVDFYEQNHLGDILDKYQTVKSKFFTVNKINPGSWQEASNLQTLVFDLSINNKYTNADLEYFTNRISSIEQDIYPPKMVNIFYNIHTISNDDVSFPDAESVQSPDNIIAISLLVDHQGNDLQRIVYILANQQLDENYLTNQSLSISIVPVDSEKELIQQFYQGLKMFGSDRLISINDQTSNINYLGWKSRKLGIQIPNFGKILISEPYFIQDSKEKLWKLHAPGISQIDCLDFYRRLYPQLESHRFNVLTELILNQQLPEVQNSEIIRHYQNGTKEDYHFIINLLVSNTDLLYKLWTQSEIDKQLSVMANFWKADPEDVLVQSKNKLFEDLLRYINPDIPSEKCVLGNPPLINRQPGIHYNVYLYSLSELYLDELNSLRDPLAIFIVRYFSGSNDGLIPFKSGYFPVNFDQISEKILNRFSQKDLIWLEENFFAVKGDPLSTLPNNNGPYNRCNYVDFIPLVIVVNQSWILINSSEIIFKKGLNAAVRPQFKLIEKYVNYIVEQLIKDNNYEISFPELPTNLDDFVLEMKIRSEDFSRPPESKIKLINQLQEIGIPITNSWKKVKYIRTIHGPLIEEIYSQNPQHYINNIDINWYNTTLNRVIRSIFA